MTMHRILTALVLVLAAALGAGVTVLYPILVPKPPAPAAPAAPIITLWRIFPLGGPAALAVCKQGFQQAFLNAKFTQPQIMIEPGDGIQVRAQADGFSAVGMCMAPRGIAMVIISGHDVAAVDERIQLVTAVAMPPPRAPAAQPPAAQAPAPQVPASQVPASQVPAPQPPAR